MSDILKNTNLPSDIKTFKKVVNISLSLLEDIDHRTFYSPYSIIPIILQALGLNTPLMGSGDSPYSIISATFKLQNKKKMLNQMFMLPLIEKRRIINEMYEMIAPYLLEEEKEYIDLLIKTKYKPLLGESKKKTRDFTIITHEKFSALSHLIDRFNNGNGDFGYIAHYGYPEDLYREYDFLEDLPESLATEWRNRSYPVVNEIFIKNFSAINSKMKGSVKGWGLFICNYTKELLEDSRLRKRRILQAARLAEKLGSKIIGMGGLIASFAQGGHGLSKEISNVGFTTGHAYTIGNIIKIMENCTEKIKFDIKKSTFAIVGAAGSIGSGCSKLLAEKAIKQLILIDLSTFSAHNRLEELKINIQKRNPTLGIEISSTFKDIKRADIVICATNSPTSIISSKYLKRGAIVIDDSFPKNISKQILKDRNDIILLEGGVVRLPFSVEVCLARNMPDLLDVPLTRLISCKETYGCFAETLVLSLYGRKKNYGLGYSDPKLAKDIMLKAKKIGFSSAPLQCFDEAVEAERFIEVKRHRVG
ncbi:MAG: hypothetical protein ACMUIU_05090 [bacterium]